MRRANRIGGVMIIQSDARSTKWGEGAGEQGCRREGVWVQGRGVNFVHIGAGGRVSFVHNREECEEGFFNR